MSKICPKCRREQDDPSHLGCEKCKVPFVDAAELVTNFTREELKDIAGFLLKDWRVYVVAGIFLAVGVALLYWQVHEGIRTQIEKFQASASNQVATHTRPLQTNSLPSFRYSQQMRATKSPKRILRLQTRLQASFKRRELSKQLKTLPEAKRK